MTYVSCPDCRLRFTPAAAAYLPGCPECGEPLQHKIRLSEAVGYRLFRLDDMPLSLPEAIAIAMQPPGPPLGRS